MTIPFEQQEPYSRVGKPYPLFWRLGLGLSLVFHAVLVVFIILQHPTPPPTLTVPKEIEFILQHDAKIGTATIPASHKKASPSQKIIPAKKELKKLNVEKPKKPLAPKQQAPKIARKLSAVKQSHMVSRVEKAHHHQITTPQTESQELARSTDLRPSVSRFQEPQNTGSVSRTDVTSSVPDSSVLRHANSASQQVSSSGADFNAQSVQAMQTWKASIVGRLERYKHYPKIAREQQLQGISHLRFALGRRGNVLSSRIEKSSGVALLDEETLALVRRAEPFPPLPKTTKSERLELVVPIQFSLKSRI